MLVEAAVVVPAAVALGLAVVPVARLGWVSVPAGAAEPNCKLGRRAAGPELLVVRRSTGRPVAESEAG